MPKFCIPTFGNGRNNTKTACICLYRVSFPTCIGKPGAIFSAHVNIRQTSSVVMPGFRQTVCALRRSWHSLRFNCFPGPFDIMPLSCCGDVGQGTSVCRFKSVPTWWLCGPIGACATRLSPARIFVLLSSSLSMLSGEILLRLKPYLVVKISSDIVTEHCCQVCVLSMMFCRSDCRLCADMVSDCAIKLVGEPCGLT